MNTIERSDSLDFKCQANRSCQANHGSQPSEGDKDVTDRMIQVGNIVDVEVLDHFIISEKYYYSFEEHGLMAELRQSTKWVPTFIEIERIKKQALKLGEKKGRKEGRKEGKKIGIEKGLEKGRKEGLKEGEKSGAEKEKLNMARKSLKEGLPLELVAKITGLSIEEIEKL